MSEVSLAVGKKIKEYRRKKKLSLEQVAAAINKSKSSLSKYEQGTVAMDIETICDIAQALQISVHKLLDIQEDWLTTARTAKGSVSDHPDMLYLYLQSYSSDTYYSGVIELEEDGRATLFFNVSPRSDYHDCGTVYDGEFYENQALSQFFFRNEIALQDTLFISLMNAVPALPFYMGECICATLPPQPVFSKCIISKCKLEKDVIKQHLHITDWELKSLRRTHAFRIDPVLQYAIDGIASNTES